MECPVCLENYKNPRILICGHSYCEECLFAQIKDEVVVCPECRQEISMTNIFFPKNLALIHLMEEYEALSKTKNGVNSQIPEKNKISVIDLEDDDFEIKNESPNNIKPFNIKPHNIKLYHPQFINLNLDAPAYNPAISTKAPIIQPKPLIKQESVNSSIPKKMPSDQSEPKIIADSSEVLEYHYEANVNQNLNPGRIYPKQNESMANPFAALAYNPQTFAYMNNQINPYNQQHSEFVHPNYQPQRLNPFYPVLPNGPYYPFNLTPYQNENPYPYNPSK